MTPKQLEKWAKKHGIKLQNISRIPEWHTAKLQFSNGAWMCGHADRYAKACDVLVDALAEAGLYLSTRGEAPPQ